MPSDIYDFPVLGDRDHVSMHLLVLSAFQQVKMTSNDSSFTLSQCTFWCSVLSDSLLFQLLCGPLPSLNAPSGAQCFPTMAWDSLAQRVMVSQCTFWCSVLSDNAILAKEETERGLNAPSGAQCFPTDRHHPLNATPVLRLNAPSGAQCFPTVILALAIMRLKVSMHLLVLSAFRHSTSTLPSSRSSGLNAPSGAQCFPT